MRQRGTASDKFILKHHLQPSRKAELGRYLCSLEWPLLLSPLETCDELLSVFEQVIHSGLDVLMPARKVRMITREATLNDATLERSNPEKARGFSQ